ncbi:hypothetical protein HA052_15150 [Chromobacterium haemolyticum]|uniref:Flavodoxin-like fold domain-containing protein n=1 Tax=Chromobacterium fluminis TaxID=3044269 RepID=A0ABX0LC36_9NEIS|nr:hypothetical protein [Chromobacterium haemolyticum]
MLTTRQTDGFPPLNAWRPHEPTRPDHPRPPGPGIADRPIRRAGAAEQRKRLAADLVIMLLPLWWCGLPALHKGWIDRVYA